MSIIIAHPTVAPFVQQAARSLYEAAQLDVYVTTVCDGRHGIWPRLAPATFRRQLVRRCVTEVPLNRVRCHPAREILRLAIGRMLGGRAADRVWEWAEHGFDRAVAGHLGPRLSAVYGYEHCTEITFTAARELGLRRVYDVPAPEPNHVRAMLDRETARQPALDTPLYRHNRDRETARTERRRREWAMADRVIAASRFTRSTYADAGFDVNKVHVVPYGAPPVTDRDSALAARKPAGRVRLVWAGTFSVRKGGHYAIEAWRRGRLGRLAELQIFGSNGLPRQVSEPWPEGMHFRGPISREQLMGEYLAADALLFPTLCDGFGMVVTEAWSRGCPVITTLAAGAAELLRPGYNGSLIPAGAADPIIEIVERCAAERAALAAMREGALATAASWQWSDYRRSLIAAIRSLEGIG